MKKRPISILIVSFICILIAPLYLGYHLWFQSLDLMTSFATLNPAHLLITMVAFPVGFGIYQVKKWGYLSFLSFAVGLVIYFLYQYFKAPILPNYIILLTTVLLVGGLSLLLQKHITAPYFNPQLRWWDRDPRYRVNLVADFQIDGDVRRGSLLDISMSGCYAKIDTKLSSGDIIYLNLSILDLRFKAMAKIIWVNKESCYGVMFVDVNSNSKKELRSILNYLMLTKSESAEDFINTGVPNNITT